MKEYRKKHKFCPACGSDNYSTTLAAYVLIEGQEDKYKDLNRCVCNQCGDKHTVHDRVEKFL